MNQRIVIPVRLAFGAGRHIGLVEISQEYGRQTFQIADARSMIVSGGARGLVGLVQIADVHLVHQP